MTATEAPTIGLAEAARVSGVSESTIRRRRTELLELGATHGPKGWAIPIPALVELGLMSATTPPDPVAAPEPVPLAPVRAVVTPDELEALRDALTAAELRAAVAEAVLVERDRLLAERQLLVESQADQLRMLEAPAVAPVTPSERVEPTTAPAAAPEAVQPPTASRRQWWPFRLR